MSETESDPEQEQVVTVSKHGQATIPKQFREELGIEVPGRVKFVRTRRGDVVVEPIRSLTDLRGILGGRTDDEGRTAAEILREERGRDERRERAMIERLNSDATTDANDDPDGE